MTQVDLHMHTKFSGDAIISPKLIADQLYAHPFIKGVAVTDHDTLQGYYQVRRLAGAYEDVLVIPGIEVSTPQGHLTILGIEEDPTYPSTIWDVVDFARERAGVIVVPHPYRQLGVGDVAKRIRADAIEVFNPRSTDGENRNAEQLAREMGFSRVAGSDAHKPEQMWTACTEVKAELNVDAVLDAIKRSMVKPSRR